MPHKHTSTPKASEIDFSTRADPADLPEWMEEVSSYHEFRDCLRELDQVNRWTLGFRPTRLFLKRVASRQYPQRLRVLEVGYGSGTGLRIFGQNAKKRGLAVRLTGVDLSPMAAGAAAELTSAFPLDGWSGPAAWLTGDALSTPEAQGQDVIFSNLVTHHMRDAEIVAFLRWMDQTASVGWFINDLLRSARSYRVFNVLSRVMRWGPLVRHDGPVSIRRGFRQEDWLRLLGEAGIAPGAVRFDRSAPGRLCLTRLH